MMTPTMVMSSAASEAEPDLEAQRPAAGLVPAEAGFFCLVDLRRFLAAPTWAAEDALWRHLLARTNVNLTPGSACRAPDPGFFHLCFAAVAPGIAVAAVRRIADVLR